MEMLSSTSQPPSWSLISRIIENLIFSMVGGFDRTRHFVPVCNGSGTLECRDGNYASILTNWELNMPNTVKPLPAKAELTDSSRVTLMIACTVLLH